MISSFITSFAALLEPHLGRSKELLAEQITLAPENIQGDLAFPCFKCAKELGINPAELAKQTVEKINAQTSFSDTIIASVITVGPYINAILNPAVLARQVLSAIKDQKAEYGHGQPTHKKILVEGRQPNTHKAVHIGHIRNILVSESVSRVLKFAGNDVIKCCYPGDIGAHVAKWIRYYVNFYPEKGNFPTKNFTRRVGQLYTAATKKVDENPDLYKAQIETLQKQLEDGDPELQKLWKETRELCLLDMKKIFAELGSGDIDKRYFESEVEQPGIQIVKQMLADGTAEISQGATAINLEQRDLGRFLLLKSTGASLYSTKDIALAYKKREDFPDYDISLYVVGSEQEHHFKQLFKTLEIIGFDHDKLHHLSYGLIDLKSGKMSSREGNIILYEDFRDQLLEYANSLMAERDLPIEKKADIARKVAFAAMKFAILLQDSEKRMTFDETQALSFEGETGPYLLYTVARMKSILRNAQTKHEIRTIGEETALDMIDATPILLHLAQFSDTVQKSAQTYKPNYIARYCLDLAQLFNSYYHNHKIIDETNPQLTAARLSLIQSGIQVFENGLNLLGIQTVEQM